MEKEKTEYSMSLEEFLAEILLFLMEHHAKNENDKERFLNNCGILYYNVVPIQRRFQNNEYDRCSLFDMYRQLIEVFPEFKEAITSYIDLVLLKYRGFIHPDRKQAEKDFDIYFEEQGKIILDIEFWKSWLDIKKVTSFTEDNIICFLRNITNLYMEKIENRIRHQKIVECIPKKDNCVIYTSCFRYVTFVIKHDEQNERDDILCLFKLLKLKNEKKELALCYIGKIDEISMKNEVLRIYNKLVREKNG